MQARTRDKLRKLVFLAGAIICLTPWASPLVAILLGSFLSLALVNPYPQLGRILSEWLLEISVVLLGFGMSFAVVLEAMQRGARLSTEVILCTLGGGLLLGRLLGINLRESVLISAGTAICGGTAVLAVGSIVRAEEGDITVAIGIVSLLNTAALYLFPVIGRALNLNQQQFGVWAGLSIHDVSSVVAAGEAYGQKAIQVATAIKLARVAWILPLTLLLSIGTGIKAPNCKKAGNKTRRLYVPWFIGLFLLACMSKQIVPAVMNVAPIFTRMGESGLILTFFLMGANISRGTFRALGWRTAMQGILLWVGVSALPLFLVLHG